MLFLHKIKRGLRVVWAFAISLTELVVRRPQTRSSRAEWLTRFCRRVLKAVDVTWSATGPVPDQGAVISNHLTYVDILLHSALRPCVFVSAIEIRHIPLIGWISMMAGTVYVTRGAGGSAAKAAGGMSEGFRDGLPVVFFPEGGTGIGDVPLLPLRTGLLATAIEEGATVTPGFIHYELSPIDVRLGKTSQNDVHWGKQTLFQHVWNFLDMHEVHARIDFAPGPISFSPEALLDRKIAAEQARSALLALHDPTGDIDFVLQPK